MNRFVRKFVTTMGENGKSPFNGTNPAANPIFPGYPWYGSYCGDLDLTGFRKPESYYRDILWNGGNRVYAAVRLPDPEGKKIFAIGWTVFPTIASWTWPGHEGKDMQVEVYSGTEKVRLFLNDKLVGEARTSRDQQFRAFFTVPYAPGVLRAEGVRGDRAVAKAILTTASQPISLRLTPDRKGIRSDGQDLSFITVEALDAVDQLQPRACSRHCSVVRGPGLDHAHSEGERLG
jgi:beta-galactosidase